jgi:hypothetical protein
VLGKFRLLKLKHFSHGDRQHIENEGSGRLDLIKIIHDLRQERDKLIAIISSLEQLQGSGPSVSQNQTARRGRRSMDAAGRLEVSRRMKQYWENRRKQGEFEGGSHSGTDSMGA